MRENMPNITIGKAGHILKIIDSEFEYIPPIHKTIADIIIIINSLPRVISNYSKIYQYIYNLKKNEKYK